VRWITLIDVGGAGEVPAASVRPVDAAALAYA